MSFEWEMDFGILKRRFFFACYTDETFQLILFSETTVNCFKHMAVFSSTSSGQCLVESVQLPSILWATFALQIMLETVPNSTFYLNVEITKSFVAVITY